MKTYKRYTISTYVFKSLKEAEARIQQWEEEGTFNKDSQVFEVVARYQPKIKLVRVR